MKDPYNTISKRLTRLASMCGRSYVLVILYVVISDILAREYHLGLYAVHFFVWIALWTGTLVVELAENSTIRTPTTTILHTSATRKPPYPVNVN